MIIAVLLRIYKDNCKYYCKVCVDPTIDTLKESIEIPYYSYLWFFT